MEINNRKLDNEDLQTVQTWFYSGYTYAEAIEYIKQCIAFSSHCIQRDEVPGSEIAEASGFFDTDTISGFCNYYTFFNGLNFAQRGYLESPAFQQLMYTWLC